MTAVNETNSLALEHIEEITLIAGAGSFENPFAGGEVLSVQITQKGAIATADNYAADWLTDPNSIAIDSDNGASVDVLSILVKGRY